jgi:hypothetical protein
MLTNQWLNACLLLVGQPGDLYAAERKIFRSRSIRFESPTSDIDLLDIGYTKTKISMLKKLYLHQESYDKAIQMWDYFVERGKYSSTSFHCYNHLIKPGATSPLEKVSTRGPCLQSVVISHLDKDHAEMDIFYRTTELFKKFPADLYFIYNNLIPGFNFKEVKLKSVNCHFANITLHPMYFLTAAALYDSPMEFYKALDKSDRFSRYVMRWTLKYLDDDRGILKFKQATVTRDRARSLLYPAETRRIIKLAKDYLNEF